MAFQRSLSNAVCTLGNGARCNSSGGMDFESPGVKIKKSSKSSRTFFRSEGDNLGKSCA